MKEIFIEFYINKYYCIKSFDEADVSFMSAITKRRLSKLDKCALSTMNKCFSDNIENIIFSSKTGEIERLLKLISQYTTEGEASPTIFSGSVHNYIAGFFLLNLRKTIPYSALSAGKDSLSHGILAAVISKYNNNLFCYADSEGDNFFSMSVSISKKPSLNAQKYRLILTNNPDNIADFNDFSELFEGRSNKIYTPVCTIERISNDK